ncbi:hypothetical protein LCGC14_2728910 [marine sediment metagenome]|uniref:Histidine kinase/HSP90-like ATPase domain-containing protein n=1 Tax=marine sediment metagenome TaxID=412755 RepID=A0A0F8ZVD0_9ZZZZ
MTNAVSERGQIHTVTHRAAYLCNNRKNSSGIGLHLTKELVDLHKGNIKVKSLKGSEFTVTLHKGKSHFGNTEIVQETDVPIDDKKELLRAVIEIALGVAPMWSGASRALRLVGRSNALDLLLLGRKITAAEALTMNLVNQVASVDDFAESVNQLAQQLAAKAPLAVAAIIRVLNQSQDLDLDKALSVELDEFCSLAGTKDNIEGVTALFEKRKPVFTGE